MSIHLRTYSNQPDTESEFIHRDVIAGVLAGNTSKAAMVFRRYDKLILRYILSLNKELDRWDGLDPLEFAQELRKEKRNQGVDIEAPLGPLLKEYHEALLRYSEILKFDSPAPRTLRNLQKTTHPSHGNTDKTRSNDRDLERAEDATPSGAEKVLDDPTLPQAYRLRRRGMKVGYYPDLVGLYTPAENDGVSRVVYKFLWFLFIDGESSIKGTEENREIYVDEEKVQKFVTFLGMVFAVGFLVAAMWVLWKEGEHMEAKLGTVTGFIVAFACWVGFCTSAGRKEVITATSAYAAVLVVYVGSTT